jgi:hypothetical protein
MSIESLKSNFIYDCTVNLSKMEDLLTKISSDCSFSFRSSFENSKEVMTDLYDKENVIARRFNYFRFPLHVK